MMRLMNSSHMTMFVVHLTGSGPSLDSSHGIAGTSPEHRFHMDWTASEPRSRYDCCLSGLPTSLSDVIDSPLIYLSLLVLWKLVLTDFDTIDW